MKYTYVSTDGSKCDIAIVSKDLLRNCTMTAESFNDVFYDALKTSVTHIEAYEKAEGFHYEYFEKRRYSSYEAFKQIQYRNHKKK
jgi:hypothetical protein